MERLSLREVLEGSGGKLVKGNENDFISGVAIDSRIVQKDELFVPIVGEVHDAHKFIPDVVAKGVRTIFVSDESKIPEEAVNVILVEDTLRAMQLLAKYYLDKLNPRRIAVTGSVGKTTTRDMVYYICAEKYKTGRPEKNFNNTVGVPLTIFSFDSDIEAAVFEEGMDGKGQIHDITNITRPEVAIITNVGISHMERLGSRENIRRAKMEITDFFGPGNYLVINQNNDMLNKDEIHADFQVITVDEETDADYIVKNIEVLGEDGIRFVLLHEEKEYNIKLGVPGKHNAINAALAMAGCEKLGISIEEAIRGLSKLEITGRRLKFRRNGHVLLLDDSYNAAPESMKSSINILLSTEGKRHIAILGSMYELGDKSKDYHIEIGEYVASKGVDMLIAVGDLAKDMAKAAENAGIEVHWFESAEKLAKEIKNFVADDDTILVKASNAVKLGTVSDEIINEIWK